MNKKTDLTGTSKGYKIFSVIILVAMVLFFLFPLYWIVTGSFKDRIEITAREPIWFPMDPTVENYAKLFDNPAFLWLFNIILSPPLWRATPWARSGSSAGASCSPSSSAPWPCPSRSSSFPWPS